MIGFCEGGDEPTLDQLRRKLYIGYHVVILLDWRTKKPPWANKF